ncbi:MAG: FtsQ-type POTRA domain-containing protein [Ruminococcaceae bacterium]|nr:FtsQ-type POTRA domain-containing protein [Oscillospiraceae bacterium]
MSKKQKKIKKGKLFSFIFITLLICAGIISFCLFTPFFNVKELAVSGNETIADSELIESSGIVFGTNIFRVNTRAVKNNIKKNPMVDNVKIKRRIPGRIDLIVEETAPQLIIPYMTGCVLINENAKVLMLSDEIPELLIPKVSGIEVAEAKICKKLVPEDKVSFEMIMECVGYFHKFDAIKYFRSMDFTNLSNFSGVTHEGVKVIFGKMEDLEYKIKFMQSVMPNIDKAEGTYIDISSSSKGIYGTLDNEEEDISTQEPDAADEANNTKEKNPSPSPAV